MGSVFLSHMPLYLCLLQEWDDMFLTWNPDDYEGLETLCLPCNKIWYEHLIYVCIPRFKHGDKCILQDLVTIYTSSYL